jgi:adenylate cyclase
MTDAEFPLREAESLQASLWQRLRAVPWPRTLRLTSGIIIFVFLTMHLANHAVGIFGFDLLNSVQTFRWKIWMNPVGVTLLYGAFAVHITLGLWRLVNRRTFRVPIDEAAQIVSGLIIPLLLLPHIVETRVALTWFGASGYYGPVLKDLWPDKAVWQTLLVLIAWGHGVLGIQLAFRHRPWFVRLRPLGVFVAIALPLLALAGFVTSGREVQLYIKSVGLSAETHAQMAGIHMISTTAYAGLALLFAALAASLNIQFLRRKIGRRLTFTFRGRGPVRVPQGSSVLDASHIHGIPHPGICRGKGRCSTCRVQILSDLAELPEPTPAERLTLDKIGAPPNIRLACQLRPKGDITVRILLPVLGQGRDVETGAEAERWAVEKLATVLVLDIRAFEVLVNSQLPYELSVLVNRFSLEMQQAVRNHSGSVASFYGDGLIAIFDVEDKPELGARRALECARDMSRVLKILNKEMGGALPIPIRAGIGIHSGKITLARIGDSEAESVTMAFGDGVNIANALQRATKSLLADGIISAESAELARLDVSALRRIEVEVDRKDETIGAYALNDWRSVGRRVGASARQKLVESE